MSQYPSLYEINTRVLIEDLSRQLGRLATLDDVPDAYLDRLSSQKFDWVWFLGVWQTGSAGRKVSREMPELLEEYRYALPDYTEQDICGSCFAITGYRVHTDFGGNAALQRLRQRLIQRGIKLLLDFIPNHTALDHPWVGQHPEYYVQSDEEHLRREPQNYISMDVNGRPAIFAYGRDPYFTGWPDTLQLNYAEPSLQSAMIEELKKVAALCDGLRCDMAMLLLPDVFERTWGRRPEAFWPKAIANIRAAHPNFLFLAEVYWDLEWTLQQQGFDYTYDKRLYDHLRAGQAHPIREHFMAGMDFQRKSVRFLENHDESRAASTFPLEQHRAAAVLTFLCPGLHFFHDGQFEGRTIKVPVQLARRAQEDPNPAIIEFYDRLLACVNLLCVKDGHWKLLSCSPAWEGNWTVDCFACFSWELRSEKLLVVVNYAPNQSQCYVQFTDLSESAIVLRDLIGHAVYERDGADLSTRGLYLDLPAWGCHVFRMTKAVG